MFAKLLRVNRNTTYTTNQEALWLELSNYLHQFFTFAYDDDNDGLPLSIVPVAKALKALRRTLMKSGDTDGETVWRQLPKEHLDAATEKIYKSSSEEFGGLHVEIFFFFEVALDYMNTYEQQLKQGLVHLCNVASGADDTDSIEFEEYNVIVDVVEPSLPASMRVTLFHVFCENALKKEGKKWESEALAMTLLEHNLPLERLNGIYIVPIKKLKSLVEQKHNAVASR